MLPKSEWWDWLKYMTLLFDMEPSAMRSTLTIVEDPVFFSHFTSMRNFVDYRTAIANYVGFKAMVTLAPLMPPGYAVLYDLGYGYDIPRVEPPLLPCTLLLEKMYRYGIGIAAKLTLSREFANVYRRHRDGQLKELFNKTRLVFRQMLGSGQSWFSPRDLNQALRKLDAMAIAFGTQGNFVQYENYRHTPPLPLESNDTLLGTAFSMLSYASRIYWSAWTTRGTTGEAYDNAYDASVFDWECEYQPTNNLVFLPNSIVAFLTAVSNKIPFQLYPVVLAHIVRGVVKALLRSNSAFDDEGRALSGSWWSAASVGASENVTECFQRQYRAAAEAESGGGRLSAGKWSVARLEEAFLDNALLVPLYELYERALSDHNATDMFYQLSDSQVSARELFFYNYAVAFCDDGDNESRSGQHWMAITPRKWRVNVPLKNFPPFRKIFSCDDWKQPHLYCNVWKGFS
nr:neprilysin-1-like [Dermacentor andersoni]